MNLFEPLQPSGPLPAGAGQSLLPGDMLEEFKITQVLGLTSFGVLYLARHAVDGTTVAIKEYLPSSIAARGTDGRIGLTDPLHDEAYQRGLQSFVSEALTLSQFDHPHLLRVSCIWEGNGTAYRAMPLLAGTTLLAQRGSTREPFSQAQLLRLRDGLLGALLALHQAGLAHGHVEPLNVYLLADGQPVLMDFGAVRLAVLSDLRKPHLDAYADPSKTQDLFTADLHAAAAVLHFAISNDWALPRRGKTYQPLADVLLRFADSASVLDYRPEFLHAIDTALALPPAERPGSVTEFRALFEPKPAVMPTASADEAEAANLATGGESTSEPAAKRAPPPPEPTQPLSSTESVLALLANFGRGPTHAAEHVEPFQSPLVPTLTEEAEPTLPPMRTSLFDAMEAGDSLPEGVGYGPVGYTPMPRVPHNPWQRWLVITGIVVAVLGCVGILSWQLFRI